MAVIPEDDMFNEVERTSKVRQEIIKRRMEPAKTQQEFYDELRNNILEEVAVEFEKMKSGGDTTASFASFVRGLKK